MDFKLNDAVYAPHHERHATHERVLCRVVAVRPPGNRIVIRGQLSSHLAYEVNAESCVPIGVFVRAYFFRIFPYWRHVPEPDAKPVSLE